MIGNEELPSRTFNWEQVWAVYVQGYIDEDGASRAYSLRELGRKFNVAPSTISRHAREGNWEAERLKTTKRKIAGVAQNIEDRHVEKIKAVVQEAEAVGRSASAVHQVAAPRFIGEFPPQISYEAGILLLGAQGNRYWHLDRYREKLGDLSDTKYPAAFPEVIAVTGDPRGSSYACARAAGILAEYLRKKTSNE